jgi:copper chaperone CopZ
MKKLLIILLALTLGAGMATAQPKKAKNTEVVKFHPDLDCENYAKKILNVIHFKKGVKDCVVDVPAKTVEITFDTRKTNAEKLAAELEKIDVHIVECNPQAGPCVGEHTKQDACCGGHDDSHDHSGNNHAH